MHLVDGVFVCVIIVVKTILSKTMTSAMRRNMKNIAPLSPEVVVGQDDEAQIGAEEEVRVHVGCVVEVEEPVAGLDGQVAEGAVVESLAFRVHHVGKPVRSVSLFL